MTIIELAKLPYRERKRSEKDCEQLKFASGVLNYVREHADELEGLTDIQLAFIARYCCHASSQAMRLEYPIDGDHRPTAQEKAEIETFGDDEGKPANYLRLVNTEQS